MKREWMEDDRHAAIQQAASGWFRSGAITAETEKTIALRWPIASRTYALIWRVAAFILTVIGVSAVYGFTFSFLSLFWSTNFGVGFPLLFLGLGTAAAAELCWYHPVTRRCGANLALALFAVGSLAAGLFSLTTFDDPNVVLLTGVSLFTVAAWRWGLSTMAVLATGCFFGWVYFRSGPFQSYGPDMFIHLVLATVMVGIAAWLRSRTTVPAYRRCWTGIQIVSLIWTYLVVNLTFLSLIHSLIDGNTTSPLTSELPTHAAPPIPIPLLIGIVLIPVAVLLWGFRTRDTLLLDVGLFMVAASIVTIRIHIHLMPAWIALCAGGFLLAGFAFYLEHFLKKRPDSEWHGFTCLPLYEDETRQQALHVAAVAVTIQPTARGTTPTEGFKGGGGTFDGGGSSNPF